MNIEATLSEHLNRNNMLEWTLMIGPADSAEVTRAVEFPAGGNLRQAQQRASRVLKGWGYKVTWKRHTGTLRSTR